jgi:hypothetical protein
MGLKHLHQHTDEELLEWAKDTDDSELLYWTSEEYVQMIQKATYGTESAEDYLNRRRGVYAAELARRRLGLNDEK